MRPASAPAGRPNVAVPVSRDSSPWSSPCAQSPSLGGDGYRLSSLGAWHRWATALSRLRRGMVAVNSGAAARAVRRARAQGSTWRRAGSHAHASRARRPAAARLCSARRPWPPGQPDRESPRYIPSNLKSLQQTGRQSKLKPTRQFEGWTPIEDKPSCSNTPENVDSYTTVDVSDNVGTDVDEDVVTSQPVIPFVGMVFDTIGEAQKIYNDYALKMGFETRIGSSRTSKKNGELIRRDFECGHARKPIETNANSAGTVSSSSNTGSLVSAKPTVKTRDKRQRDKVIRYNCKAHMTVGLQGGKWYVRVIKTDHNHPMVRLVRVRRLYRSHRKISREDYDFLKTLHNRNIPTAQMMALAGDLRGGVRNLTFTTKDVSNMRTNLRKHHSFQDLNVTVEQFRKIQSESPSFYYATQMGEDNTAKSLFWVDGRTRVMYQAFGDCVFFDTTFMTNRYGMPFAPFVGINNHARTILLGCALIQDETADTFAWLFETWLLSMHGKSPKCMTTDQDRAMKAAIARVFPNTVHRCCKWHVMKNARDKLRSLFATKEGFADELHKIIADSQAVGEFETSWQMMCERYGLLENQHLLNMWNTRKSWAPVYFRQSFFPFTSTTGRSEGLNAVFKSLVHPSDSVWSFVKQYEFIIENMISKEDGDKFKGQTSTPSLWSRYNLEAQAANFYTRSIFYKFQNLLMQSTSYTCTRLICPAGTEQYNLKAIWGDNGRTFVVSVLDQGSKFSCSCNMFEMDGLLCPHILKVMTQNDLQEIPERYLLKRWSHHATQSALESLSNSEPCFGVPKTNVLRFNSLCRKLTVLASEGSVDEHAYNTVSKFIAITREKLAESTTNPISQVDSVQQDANNFLRNPTKVKSKGRPTEKSRRKKPTSELAADKNKKRKNTIRCSHCQGESHNTQTCQLLKIARFQDSFFARQE